VPNYLWLVLSSTLAAWGVLAAGKVWEGIGDRHGLRRFPLLALGFLVGGASFLLAQFLNFQPSHILPLDHGNRPGNFHASDGTPLLGAYLVFFGVLFFAVRWWRQADPMRHRRLSVVQCLVVMLTAIVLSAFCPLPQGFLIAGATSVAVQLAAPWLSDDDQRQLRERLS
jgi:hypothetical protein